jgi:broad specificity phosphatase PhoE
MSDEAGRTADDRSCPATAVLFSTRETLWSLSGRHIGVTDFLLTVHGETQSRALEPWVGGIAFSHVLTSARLRAHATCELVGLGGHARIEPDLAEWNYGDYEGRRSVDICEERPGWDIFRDCCPNGESPFAIGERIDRLIARLRTMDGDVALFSHGRFGAVFGTRWIGLPVFAARHCEVGPESMSVLSWNLDHPKFASSPFDAAAGGRAQTQ